MVVKLAGSLANFSVNGTRAYSDDRSNCMCVCLYISVALNTADNHNPVTRISNVTCRVTQTILDTRDINITPVVGPCRLLDWGLAV